MPDLNLVAAGLPVPDETYVASCWKCGEKFNAATASWCSCDRNMRTLECLHCGSCFCQAPSVYQQRFWKDAPKSLCENPRRFALTARNVVASGLDHDRVPNAAPSPRPHVLIVDDDEAMRSLAVCYVEQMGYEVSTASSAEEALLTVDAIPFDVVLTDALMPKMDGRELSRRLKEMLGNRIKVILMTSLYKSNRYRTEAQHVFRVDEYLVKPLNYDELRDALQRVAPLFGSHEAPRATAV